MEFQMAAMAAILFFQNAANFDPPKKVKSQIRISPNIFSWSQVTIKNILIGLKGDTQLRKYSSGGGNVDGLKQGEK